VIHTNSSKLEHQTREGGLAGTAALQNNCARQVLESTTRTEKLNKQIKEKYYYLTMRNSSPEALLACNMPAVCPRTLREREFLARQTKPYLCGTVAEDLDSCVSCQMVLCSPHLD
jgi:hypothetical protein